MLGAFCILYYPAAFSAAWPFLTSLTVTHFALPSQPPSQLLQQERSIQILLCECDISCSVGAQGATFPPKEVVQVADEGSS